MGTTVVVALVTPGEVHYAGIGDSRVYLFHDARLFQLTHDDTWLAHVVASGGSPGPDHPMRHVLTSVVGAQDDVDVTVTARPALARDRFVLCSDGVHGSIGADEIGRLVSSADTVQRAAERLVAAALERDGRDNLTAVVVSVDS